MTQAIGAAASFLGLEGLIAPSARSREGTNAVVLTANIPASSAIVVESSERVDLGKIG